MPSFSTIRRVLHGVTPIAPLNPSLRASRDVLVLAFRRDQPAGYSQNVNGASEWIGQMVCEAGAPSLSASGTSATLKRRGLTSASKPFSDISASPAHVGE